MKKAYVTPELTIKESGQSTQHEVKIIDGQTGETRQTGKQIFVVDKTPGSPLYSSNEKMFSDLLLQIRETSKVIGIKFYELGLALKQIRDNELWKYSKIRFQSFQQFVEAEKFSRATAYNLIQVATVLTREEAERYGPTVSYVVAAANDKDAMNQLKVLANKGASVREIKTVAQEIRKTSGYKARSPGRTPNKLKVVRRAINEVPERDVEVSKSDLNKNKKRRVKEGFGLEKQVINIQVRERDKRYKSGWTYTGTFHLIDNTEVRIDINTRRRLMQIDLV